MLYFDYYYYNRSDLQDMKTMLKWKAFRYDSEVKGKATRRKTINTCKYAI